MQEAMKDELDARYGYILRSLSVNWKLESKSKYEELIREGLNTSGAGVESMYNLIEKLVFNSIGNLDNIINQISKEFNNVIHFKELKKYIQRFEEAIYGHIDGMKKDIKDTFEDLTPSCEASFELRLNNIKENAKGELDRIYIKNKNLQKYKKIEWLVIFNTIATIGGFIVGIISLFK